MKTTAYLIAALILGAAASASAQSVQAEDVLRAYTGNTVIQTYADMASEAVKLNEAVDKLAAEPTDANAAVAAQAWKNTRAPWEQAEAWLFGPAAFTNLDPKLDSWPLDQTQLDIVIASVNDGKLEVDAAYVRDYLGAALRGFHAVEYLLFRDGQPRKAEDFTKGELAYLKAATTVLTEDAITLEAWWAGMDALSAPKAAILEAAEIEAGKPFGAEFIGAGKAGSRYSSQEEALEELLQGCIDIADELAAAKIAEPAKANDPQLCESWYSWTSLDDCQNNVLSIEYAYLGKNKGDASVSALVAAKDKAADAAVKVAIAKAKQNVAAIPRPFRNNLDKTAQIDAAAAACSELSAALGKAQAALTE